MFTSSEAKSLSCILDLMLRTLCFIVIFLSVSLIIFFSFPAQWANYTDKLGYFTLSYPTRYQTSGSYNPVVFTDPITKAQIELFYTSSILSPYDYARAANPQAIISSQPVQVGTVPALVEIGTYQGSSYTSHFFRHPEADIIYILTLDSRLALSKRSVSHLLTSFTFTLPQTSVPFTPTPSPLSPTLPASSGCKVGGCSSELCLDASAPDRASICVYKDEFACYKTAKCEKQSNGLCDWTQTPELKSCLGKY